MGMQSGRDEDPIADINVTPLVDICLVLVIIFMVIVPFAIETGIKVLQSKSKAGVGKVSVEENVQIRLTRDGRLTLNGKAVEKDLLSASVQKALLKSRDKMVIITAEDENRVGEVVEVLDTAKQSGAMKLAIMKANSHKSEAQSTKSEK